MGSSRRGELPEHAAIREVREEVQLDLEPAQLLPHSVIFLPSMNQTYYVFVACLQEMLPARAMPPESIDVGVVLEGRSRPDRYVGSRGGARGQLLLFDAPIEPVRRWERRL